VGRRFSTNKIPPARPLLESPLYLVPPLSAEEPNLTVSPNVGAEKRLLLLCLLCGCCCCCATVLGPVSGLGSCCCCCCAAVLDPVSGLGTRSADGNAHTHLLSAPQFSPPPLGLRRRRASSPVLLHLGAPPILPLPSAPSHTSPLAFCELSQTPPTTPFNVFIY
jgi:hypothetical protein